jgi:hypothetical protein
MNSAAGLGLSSFNDREVAMRRLTVATLCCLIACAQSPDITTRVTSDVDQPFTLHVGEVATIGTDAMSVRFAAVVVDSRCPARVQCVWAGDGAIAVEATPAGGGAQNDTLHTTLGPKTTAIGGWTLDLTGLAPYPDEPGGIAPGDYLATFVVHHTR